LNKTRNFRNALLISPDTGRVAVRVMHTDEEWMIAKTVCRVLNPASKTKD
jgi:acetate kinase